MIQMDTKNVRKEKEKTKRTETAKYFYDLSKASFSITVLGNLALIFKDGALTLMSIFGTILGLIMTVGFFIVGNKILNK